MSKYPEYISKNISTDKYFYSLEIMDNIERAKLDAEYLGDLIIVNENLIWHSVHKYIGKPDYLAKKYQLEVHDILQLGRIGFIKSIKKFDTTRGIKFSSFSVTAITREIKCFLRDNANIVRPSRTASTLINRINIIEYQLGYSPDVEALSQMLEEPVDKIKKAKTFGQPIKYLDEPNFQTSNGVQKNTYMDLIEDSFLIDEYVSSKLDTELLIEYLKTKVNSTDLRILELRIQGLTQTQVAQAEKISQMRVSRSIKKLLLIIEDYYKMYS